MNLSDSEEDIMSHDIEVTRLSKKQSGKSRVLKVNVLKKETRDLICSKSKLLKALAEPWNKIYIKKDTHPVILSENHRIRLKMKDLKSLEEYKNKDVKLENGKLTVDGITIDQNTFFG